MKSLTVAIFVFLLIPVALPSLADGRLEGQNDVSVDLASKYGTTPSPELAAAIQAKVAAVKAAIESWVEQGRDPSPAVAMMHEVPEAMTAGNIAQAEYLIDHAYALLMTAPATSSTNALMTAPATPSTNAEFTDYQPVVMEGYNGPEQDPTLSPDGAILFFDSHTDDPKIPINLYWAKKIDYKTFAFQGEIKGVNQQGKQALVATMDRDRNFYFTTTSNAPIPATAQGVFTDGTVTQVAPSKGFPSPSASPPWSPGQMINFSMVGEITQDGRTMYVSDFQIKAGNDGRPVPRGATIILYTKNSDGTFIKASNSGSILKNINALNKILYGAVASQDGLALFFTGSDVPGSGDRIRIYVAKRSATSEPFGVPEEITTPWRAVEAPYPSSDGRYVYFHRIISRSDSKIYVTTPQK
jgi:hypothetical protein